MQLREVNKMERLSQRQYEVLKLFAHGYTSIEIAAELHIAVRTVEEHLHACRLKLDARNSVNAVAIGITKGIIQLLIVISIIQAMFDDYHCDMRRPPKTRTRVVRVMRARRDKDFC